MNKKLLLIKSSILLLALGASSSFAQLRYDVPLNEGSHKLWSNQSSRISCVLSHAIIGYGRGDFYITSGRKKKISFELYPNSAVRTDSVMRFLAAPPEWQPSGANEEELGKIKLFTGFNPFVGDTVAFKMLQNLRQGKEILMPYVDDERSNNSTIVPTLSPMGFRQAYEEFYNCEQKLLNMSYPDVQITVIKFEPHQDTIYGSDMEQIKSQITYIQSDEAITSIKIAVFAFGETNNFANKDLAKRRATNLKKIYTDAGIKPEMIKVETYYKENLSLTKNQSLEASTIDARKAVITLDRDSNKIKYDLEINMPDVGRLE